MEFGILGQLRVRSGENEIVIDPPRLRMLLAFLIVRRGRPTTADAIVRGLWTDDTVERSESAAYVCVSRLRRCLKSQVLITEHGGYSLAVTPGDIDAERFETIAEEGHRQLWAADPVNAAETLRRALEMWRGPALAEFRGRAPWADAAAVRLEEVRVGVLEDRIDADLACGRAGQLIGELQVLSAEHPLREQLVARLMLALYRCGRQAEALRVYSELRARLAEDLGIVPSRSLQALELAVVRQSTWQVFGC